MGGCFECVLKEAGVSSSHPQTLKVGGGNPVVGPVLDTLTSDTLILDLQNLGRPLFGGVGVGVRSCWLDTRARSEPTWGLPSPLPPASVPSPMC